MASLKDKIKSSVVSAKTRLDDTPDPDFEDQEVIEEYLAGNIISASMYYAMGAYATYCRIHGLEQVEASVLVGAMSSIPEGLDSPEDRKRHFESMNNSVGKFLEWFMGDN